MLEKVLPIEPPEHTDHVAADGDLTELEFYQAYDWSLNPHLTVGEAVTHLRREIEKLGSMPHDWRLDEIAANVFLLAGGILNRIEEYARGDTLRLPRRLQSQRLARGLRRAVEALSNDLRPGQRPKLQEHAKHFRASLRDFLLPLATANAAVTAAQLSQASVGLAHALHQSLPESLNRKRLRVPSPFWRLDLNHRDVLSLGRRLVERHPDRSQPIVLVGLRTSGSYFCPLLQAFLDGQGYETTAALTIEPNKGPGPFEQRELRRCAREGYLAVLVDDPPHTAGALLLALGAARRAGFTAERVRFLVPTHAARRNWFKNLPRDMVITLMPEEWDKERLLRPELVKSRLNAYLLGRDIRSVRVVASARADRLNAQLSKMAAVERGVRLKRVFDIDVTLTDGSSRRKLVLARSVGFGWHAYRAFIAARKLSRFVPPVYGMRDGILYMEWSESPGAASLARDEEIARMAAYVAARVSELSLDATSLSVTALKGQDNGIEQLARTLSGAYGRFPAGMLRRGRVADSLRKHPLACPTFIDGNMRPSKWIDSGETYVKVDYEHHGLGKDVLNHIDPAYDLADAMLNFGLSPDEEQDLLAHYVELSGDADVAGRLFTNKLIAGIWEMAQAQERLVKRSLDAEMQRDTHERFMLSWHFLIREAARQCGSYCKKPAELVWHAPLVVLDIDGVIDRRVFGFPSTTLAGISALSLLHARGVSVALDTARSVAEVRDYCRAYSLVGGVAELGSYMWDAVRERGEVLLVQEDLRQLEELRKRLRAVPGVFLDDQHQYSVRAFSYRNEAQGTVAQIMESTRAAPFGQPAVGPLPAQLVSEILDELRLDRLGFHQNAIDTTFVSKQVDKGSGLIALRDWVLGSTAETIAVGDSDQDLPMFREATRSFAPSNVSHRSEAELLGCRVARAPYQRGLLEIAQLVTEGAVDAGGASGFAVGKSGSDQDLWIELLAAADRHWARNFFSSAFNRSILRAFAR